MENGLSSTSRSFSRTSSSGSSSSMDSVGKFVEHVFNDWTVRYRTSHILPSKCTNDCQPDTPCILCCFDKELKIPHLPEMVFPFNVLELKHKSGASIQFNALDALRGVNNENLTVKIACSESWTRARVDTGLVDKTPDFDWTFRTDYAGTFEGWPARKKNEEGIDLEALKKREKILLYQDLMLFEDELHDNGVAVCNVRIRVMPSGFFVLLRYFLRVDGVMLLANDTRIHHDFTTDFLLVENSQRENKVEELQVPLGMMTEPDEITPVLALRKFICEKLSLPT